MLVTRATPGSCGPRDDQCPGWPNCLVLTSPFCPYLSRSAAKAGVSTTISWIRADCGQQLWKAWTGVDTALGPARVTLTPSP